MDVQTDGRLWIYLRTSDVKRSRYEWDLNPLVTEVKVLKVRLNCGAIAHPKAVFL